MTEQGCNCQNTGPDGTPEKSCCSNSRWIILILLVGGAVLLWYYRTAKHTPVPGVSEEKYLAAWIGKPATDFSAKDMDGNTVQLSQFKGKRVILDFFATWCPPCQMEIPHFIELRKTIPGDQLVILGISNESASDLEGYAKKLNINYPILQSKTMPAPFDKIDAIPTTFFIAPDGTIQDVLQGYHDLDALRAAAMKDNHPVAK